MSVRHEVLEQGVVDDAFTALLVDVQAWVLGRLVRVDGRWGVVSHVAVVGDEGRRVAAVVLDGDVERSVFIREDQLGVVDLDAGGDVIELYVNQDRRSIVFELAP